MNDNKKKTQEPTYDKSAITDTPPPSIWYS